MHIFHGLPNLLLTPSDEPLRGSVVHQYAELDEECSGRSTRDKPSATLFQREQEDVPDSLLRSFTNHITEYSGRILTFKSDMLNAFCGLLSRAPLYSYHGIPIAISSSNDTTADFAAAFVVGL